VKEKKVKKRALISLKKAIRKKNPARKRKSKLMRSPLKRKRKKRRRRQPTLMMNGFQTEKVICVLFAS